MAYSWSFTSLYAAKKQGELDNVLTSVEYTLSYTDGVESRYSYYHGTVEFAPPDADSFIEFKQISEDDMISFVEQTLGEDLVGIMKSLQDSFVCPIELKSLPWEEDNG